MLLGTIALFGVDRACRADMAIGERTTLVFATADRGRQVLAQRDAFVRRLSPFDRSARMRSDGEVSEAMFLKFVTSNVLEWTDHERHGVETALESILGQLQALRLPLPRTILLVKTTGEEEGGAAYTRGNAICLPRGRLNSESKQLQRIVCHELFHILSRANPRIRRRFYAAVGFMPCRELTFPEELQARKITNPDAPRNDHWIELQVDGEPRAAIPILFADSATYSTGRGGQIFDYLTFRFLIVKHLPESGRVRPVRNGGRLVLRTVDEVGDFFEQVGRNTRYIIHPEEILADNFALMMLGERELPSPRIVQRMAGILQDARPVPSLEFE